MQRTPWKTRPSARPLKPPGIKLPCLLLVIFLAGCDKPQDTQPNRLTDTVASLHIPLAATVDEVIANSPVRFGADCLEAVDMCWYEADRQGALLDLSLSQPEGTLELDQVSGLSMTVDGQVSNHIQALNIDLRGLPDNSTHEQNKELIYRLIGNLKSAGWQAYYFPSDPRIPGAQWHKLDGQESLLGMTPLSHPLFDAKREMSLEEWLAVGTFYDWYLYQGNFIAHVRALRYDSKSAPLETAVYLISVNLMSLDRFWASHFAEHQRAHWKTLLPAQLQALQQRRSQAETRARAAGVTLEEGYAPPAIERSP